MKDSCYAKIYKTRSCLAPLGDIQHKALFGGYSLAVQDTVFAMVAKGELYLRASEECVEYFRKRQAPALAFTRHGRDVCLNYYKVDEALWQDEKQLLSLSKLALEGAQNEKQKRAAGGRLKDLPNLNYSLENMLWLAGIHDVETLRATGAREGWLRLRKINKTAGIRILLALAGALTGQHAAALPAQLKQELLEWAADQMHQDDNYSGK